MRIGVPLETKTGENRVAATPETVKKYVSSGHQVIIQSQAGMRASYPDSAYAAVGATIGTENEVYGSDVILKVRAPNDSELALIKPSTVLIGMLDPFDNAMISAMAGWASVIQEPTVRWLAARDFFNFIVVFQCVRRKIEHTQSLHLVRTRQRGLFKPAVHVLQHQVGSYAEKLGMGERPGKSPAPEWGLA